MENKKKMYAEESIFDLLDEVKTSMLDSGYNPSSVIIRKIESALTPESEGIAGKGDVSDINVVDIPQALDIDDGCTFDDRISNIERRSYNRGWNSYRDTLLSTLTRPQEIDVEALKWSTASAVSPEGNHTNLSGECMVMIGTIIDHLHSSGRLK